MEYKTLIFSFFFTLFFVSTSYAERIDGPANIRTKPNGIPIVSLNDGVLVECSMLENNWYQIGINIKITKEQYDNDLEKGDSLFNTQNELIGIVLNSIPDSLQMKLYYGGSLNNPRVYVMTIYASTYKSNIKPESIPESRLSKLLTSNKNILSISDLDNYVNEFEFMNHGILSRLVKKYKELSINESTIYDPSPMDRIRLIFEDSKLIAIVHTRPISTELQSQYLVRERSIIILKQMPSNELKEFLKINRQVYEGVD